MSRNPGSLAELAPVAIQCMSVHDPAFIRRSSVGQASLFSTHQQFVAMFRRQTRGNAAVWSVEQSPSDRGDLGFEVTTRERRGSPQPVCVAAPLWPGINTFYACLHRANL